MDEVVVLIEEVLRLKAEWLETRCADTCASWRESREDLALVLARRVSL